MSEVAQLHVDPQAGLVPMLLHLLQMAKDGEIHSVAYTALHHTDDTSFGIVCEEEAFRMVAATAILAAKAVNRYGP